MKISNLSDDERLVLMDSLSEFIRARVGYATLPHEVEAAAIRYVNTRYPTRSAFFQGCKIESTIQRITLAQKLYQEVCRNGEPDEGQIYS